ncbi:recombinase family protein [Tessaracoccus aquimaris]|uniref:recombinase family protein n=1 Tax=Tessaracoccus aquimaris TaxID=1332264 RepID=UPI001D043CE0
MTYEHKASQNQDATTRAVIYIRVSTRDQATRGGEAEGFSIPAQREACNRKAKALGAHVVEEFVDAGESAKSAERPELQRMLGFVKQNAVQLVIVHKVDRLARNRMDDVQINFEIQKAGAKLVSCSENIDETPSGMLLHGIMSSIAEFYSQNLATESRKGMRQKAKGGGTPGKAPFGYINTRERTRDGHERRTVIVDADRAPWVQWMFERYATGEWTAAMIAEELREQGVTVLPTPKAPNRPIATSHVDKLLMNRYYTGVVTFEGVEYPGKHEALVSEELYARCQAVRRGRRQSKEKPQIRTHYLKGSVFCGQCGEPLTYEVTRNRMGNYYEYFYCLGRQARKNGCTFVAIQAHHLEQLIEDHWTTVELDASQLTQVRHILTDHVNDSLHEQRVAREAAQRRLAQLQSKADKLMQAYYADALPVDLLKEEQGRIAVERGVIQSQLAQAEVDDERLHAALDVALQHLDRAHGRYLGCDDPQIRRDLNQAVFERIYIQDDEVAGCDLRRVFRPMLDENPVAALQEDSTPDRPSERPGVVRYFSRTFLHRERPGGLFAWERKNLQPSQAAGSNVSFLVAGTGFEPVTSGL